MKLEVLRISVDRNGSEIGREVIARKTMDDNLFKEGCVRFMTGLSLEEAYQLVCKKGGLYDNY